MKRYTVELTVFDMLGNPDVVTCKAIGLTETDAKRNSIKTALNLHPELKFYPYIAKIQQVFLNQY